MTPSRERILVAACLVLCLSRIVATYPLLNHTFDEPAHVAAGVGLWSREAVLHEVHMPLSRLAVGLGPYLGGTRPESSDPHVEEREVFYRTGNYWRSLTLARLGVLPFVLLAAGVVWAWTRSLAGSRAALLSLVCFSFLPPILAHGGLATTDMAAAATMVLALFVATRWLEEPTWARTATLGVASGLAVATKVSAVLFLSVAMAAMALAHVGPAQAPRSFVQNARRALAVLMLAFLTLWAVFGFSVGSLSSPDSRPHELLDTIVGAEGPLHDPAYRMVESPIFPAPDFWRVLLETWAKNQRGQHAYFLGYSLEGPARWAFFPVVIGLKTPIAFLVLAASGAWIVCRKLPRAGRAPLVAALAILLALLPSRIHLGVRHVLVLYPLLAIPAGIAAMRLGAGSKWSRGFAAILLAWLIVSSATSHPDYLAYMNELGGSHPDRLLVDSDLDWGQDLARLSRTAHELDVPLLHLAYFGTAEPARMLPGVLPLPSGARREGWVAVSRTLRRTERGYDWLDDFIPCRIVGRSIELYYIPEGGQPAPRGKECG